MWQWFGGVPTAQDLSSVFQFRRQNFFRNLRVSQSWELHQANQNLLRLVCKPNPDIFFYVWMVITSLFWSLPSSSSPGRLQLLLEDWCTRAQGRWAQNVWMCSPHIWNSLRRVSGVRSGAHLHPTAEGTKSCPISLIPTKMRTNYGFGELLSRALFCLFSLYW